MASATIESVLQEDRLFPPSPEFVKQANVSGAAAFQALCDEADRDFEGFWGRLAKEHVLWHKPFTRVLDESHAPSFKWFHDGELNASYNCLDRHLKTQGDKTAIIFEADDGKVTRITYRQLYHKVCQFANALKSLDIKKGDRVVIYMPMSIEVVTAMQACARIGATHSVVFGGFSAKSLQERIIDAGAVAVITADGQMRGGKEIPLKPAVDEAFTLGGCEGVKNVVVYKRTGSAVTMQATRDEWWHDVIKGQADTCEPTWVNAEHPLFILYTSGSTGKSKGVQHSTSGDLPRKSNLKSVRILGTVGEPINPEAWMWYYNTVGDKRCPIVDTWWQTETSSHLITPLPGVHALKPGSCTMPLPGIMAAIVDETGRDVEKGKGGILVIKRPWPGIIRTIWGDPERFKKNYFPDEFKGKYYLAGDGASRDKDGYFRIMGRIDDVLNVSGHRLGTMEIESALVANTKLVAEAAVVGRPDEMTGEAVVAFVVLKGPRPSGAEAKTVADELRNWVAKEIGAIAKPKDIRFGDNLPKTRSGKIMRRLLRSIAKGEEIKQDVSTLENPAILEQLKQVT